MCLEYEMISDESIVIWKWHLGYRHQTSDIVTLACRKSIDQAQIRHTGQYKWPAKRFPCEGDEEHMGHRSFYKGLVLLCRS